MKTKILIILMTPILFASCSENEKLLDQQFLPQTRSEACDMRDLGRTHNLMLDYTRDFCATSTIKSNEQNSDDSPLQILQDGLTQLIQRETPEWNFDYSSYPLKEAMNNFSFLFTQDIDSIGFLEIKGSRFYNILSPEHINGLAQKELISIQDAYFLNKILSLSRDDSNNFVSNSLIAERLTTLKAEWELLYGKNGYTKPTIDNILSGVCLCISQSSFEWWSNWLSNKPSDKQNILPLLGYLLEKDAKGAVMGVISSILAGQRDVRTIARDGLISGGVSSLFSLL